MDDDTAAEAFAEWVPHVVWIARADGFTTYVNGRGVDYLGLSSNRDLGWTWLDRIHPDDRETAQRYWNQVGATGSGAGIEYRIRTRDGSYRWNVVRSAPVKSADGTVLRWVGTYTDVNAHHAMIGEFESARQTLVEREKELDESRAHLERAQEVGRVCSAEVDLRTKMVRWSEQAYTMFGLPRQFSSPGIDTILSVIHPDDREQVRELTARTRAGELGPASEFRVVGADGTIRWIHRMSVLVRDEAGEPASILVMMQDVTERKTVELELLQREAELCASREHLARAQRVGNMGSAEVDLVSKKHIWSAGLFQLLGVKADSLLPGFDNFLSFVHPDDKKIVFDVQSAARRGIAVPDIEFRIQRSNGEIRWLRRLAETLNDAEGKPNRLIISFQDITDRRRMEDDLRTSREHLASAQRVGKLGSAEVDLVARQVHWSEGLYAVLGIDPATPPSGEIFLSLVHPDDRGRVREHRASALRGEPTDPIEFRIVRMDGTVRWIYHTVELLRGRDGNPEKLIGTDLDITDRKRDEIILRERETQLRESQEHLAEAQRIGKIGSVEVYRDQRTSRWSEEVFALLGLDPATTEPGQDAFLSVIHPDDRAAIRERRARLMRGLSNPTEEFRVVRPDTGEIRWLQFQSGSIGVGEGAKSKAITILQDITELKLAQAERSEIERRLLQAQKMEAVGNLTGGIAHDFNNLLTVILGRLDLVENELHDRPELRDWVRIAMSAARRGAALTRSMLSFARQQPLQPASIDIAGSLHDMVGLLQRTLGEAIEINVVYPPDLWACEADPAQLQTALLNLALNARDAMPQGGKLTIDARNFHVDEDYAARNADVAAGDYVALSVSDTGTGMPRDVIEHAFEPFFTTKEVGKGSGLGLSMVYGYVKQSGGHVKIYSEVGSGTTISIYLPRSIVPTAQKGEPGRAAHRLAAGGHEKLLVVEDDDDMRDLTVAVLERLGYRVYSARQAAEAIPLIELHRDIALLLTDISLPGGMNGRELAERALEIRADLKVLYMSGYSEDAIIHQGRLDPGIRLLQKPFHNEQLADEIRSILAGK